MSYTDSAIRIFNNHFSAYGPEDSFWGLVILEMEQQGAIDIDNLAEMLISMPNQELTFEELEETFELTRLDENFDVVVEEKFDIPAAELDTPVRGHFF